MDNRKLKDYDDLPLVWILGSLYLSGGILRVCGARWVEGGSPAQRSDALRRFVLGII